MTNRFFAASLAALAIAGVAGAASAQPVPMTREAYRANLMDCIKRLPACKDAKLRPQDREYVAAEVAGQSYPGDLLQRLADKQMADFEGRDGNGPPPPGSATKSPQAASPPPQPARAAAPNEMSAFAGEGSLWKTVSTAMWSGLVIVTLIGLRSAARMRSKSR